MKRRTKNKNCLIIEIIEIIVIKQNIKKLS